MKTETAKEVKERPILFSTPIVKAILEGRKTQTRRVIKPQPEESWMKGENWNRYYKNGEKFLWIQNPLVPNKEIICPYGKIGDRLWVRETFLDEENYPCSPYHWGEIPRWTYKADVPENQWYQVRWSPSIFMPRAASRITLEITDVRVERLQDISENDAEKEGINLIDFNCWENYLVDKDWIYEGRNQREYHALQDPVMSFASLWSKINGAESWNQNPFVWVIEFKKL